MSDAYGLPTSSAAPPAAQPPMSGLAIAGLVLAFLCGWPIGLVLSSIALSQTLQGARRGKGLAVAGVVVNALFAVLTVIALTLPDPLHDPVDEDNAHEAAEALEAEVDADIKAGR